MIFDFGENPTLDVVRMLMHYAIHQKKQNEQPRIKPTKQPVVESNVTATSVISPVKSSPPPSSDKKDGPRRLHVTNLPFKIKDNELRALFEEHGTVLDAEIIYNERGSKGFGFVTMEASEGAAKAKEALNGKEMGGRKIEVNNATPRSVPNKGNVRTTNRGSVHPLPIGQVSIPIAHLPSTLNAGGLNRSAMLTNNYQIPIPQFNLSAIHAAPIQSTYSLATNTIATPIPGLPCFPTPEQYTQYYNFISTHGPLRGNPHPNTSIAAYRFQPY